MTLVAGVDVGNTTTEVVLTLLRAGMPPAPLAWDRRPTRGAKGSASSWLGAARLLAALERRVGRTVDLVALTPQHPVLTQVRDLATPTVGTGRLCAGRGGSGTPGGSGVGVGVPLPVESAPRADLGPVVLVARDPLGFRQTAGQVSRWVTSGALVAAVVLAGDEARLVATRVSGWSGPVLDGVDADDLLECRRVAVEVIPGGGVVQRVNDAVWAGGALEVPPDERGDLIRATAQLSGASAGLIGLRRASRHLAHDRSADEGSSHEDRALEESTHDESALDEPAHDEPAHEQDPSRTTLSATADAALDTWCVDLATVVPAHLRTLRRDGAALATCSRPDTPTQGAAPTTRDPAPTTRDRAPTTGDAAPTSVGAAFEDYEVRVLGSEPLAALSGAATTPGIVPDDRPAVLDLGGGTIDLVVGGTALTAAGSGELLTVATAHVLGTSRAAAEWVKRGPSVRVESPYVFADEWGQRHFRDEASAPGTVGWLTAPGPSGALPFAADLQPGDWRAARWALKRATLADNVARLVKALPPGAHLGTDLLLVGGPAGDDEVLDILAGSLPGMRLGRADVAGRLGHRWAVAYGLTLMAATSGVAD